MKHVQSNTPEELVGCNFIRTFCNEEIWTRPGTGSVTQILGKRLSWCHILLNL